MANNTPKGTPSRTEREDAQNVDVPEQTAEDAAASYADATPVAKKVKSGEPGTFAGSYEVKHYEAKVKKAKDGDPGTYTGSYKPKHFVSGETDSKKKKS